MQSISYRPLHLSGVAYNVVSIHLYACGGRETQTVVGVATFGENRVEVEDITRAACFAVSGGRSLEHTLSCKTVTCANEKKAVASFISYKKHGRVLALP